MPPGRLRVTEGEDLEVLHVTIELSPSSGSKRRILVEGTITNDGTGTLTSGNYRVRLCRRDGLPWREGVVLGFPRKRRGPWRLLHLALEACEVDKR